MAEENLYTPNCIRTITGIYVNVFDPTPEMICIEDIVHSLCQQPRFGGHLPHFYSVAEHSLNCSYITEQPELKLAALLHDASEAYLMDIPKPIKGGLTNYKEIEDRLMIVIADKFGFQYPLHTEIKKVDEQMLQLEWDCLMLRTHPWTLKTKHISDIKADFINLTRYYSTLTPSHAGTECKK
jgi:uncharacterized protein